MQMISEPMRHRPIISALVASFFIAIMVWLLAKQVELFEADIFQRLISAFGSGDVKLDPDPFSNLSLTAKIATAGGFLAFASASTWAGFKLAPVPRTIVGIQLFVMSLFYQWGIWQWLAVAGHPVGYTFAILVGCMAGGGLRQLELTRRESESRYYEIKIRNKELQETRLSLVKQDEVERRMLAADLHDQVLNDMKQLVGRFEDYVSGTDKEANLEKVRALSSKVMHEIREVMESLCPSVLEHLGLVAAIEDAVRKGGERAGFKVRFRGKIDSDDLHGLSIVEQSLLYRLVQETITNICKHANASTVRATVDKVDGCLMITINDDGKGLDPAKSRSDSRGLKYMRLRADLIGATIAWKQGENDKGTKVEIRLDLTGRQAVPTDD
jgi:signal transduction histidine kinase